HLWPVRSSVAKLNESPMRARRLNAKNQEYSKDLATTITSSITASTTGEFASVRHQSLAKSTIRQAANIRVPNSHDRGIMRTGYLDARTSKYSGGCNPHVIRIGRFAMKLFRTAFALGCIAAAGMAGAAGMAPDTPKSAAGAPAASPHDVI